MRKLIALLSFIPLLVFGQTTPTWQQTINAGAAANVAKNVSLTTSGTMSVSAAAGYTVSTGSGDIHLNCDDYKLGTTGNYSLTIDGGTTYSEIITGVEGNVAINALGDYSVTVGGNRSLVGLGGVYRYVSGDIQDQIDGGATYSMSINGTTGNMNTKTIGTYSFNSTGLNTIASPSVSISGTSLRFPNLGTPGSGKVLQSDASGYATWVTPSTGITVGSTTISSGTSGAIPFNNAGVYGEDATQLFWDNTNNRLGLGTATPGAGIDLVSLGTTTGFAMNIKNSAATELFKIQDNGYIQAGDANGSLTIGVESKYNPALVGNTSVGAFHSRYVTMTGANNSLFGVNAGNGLTSGSNNLIMGRLAGSAVSTGSNNVLLGSQSGEANGDNRVFIGYSAGIINTNASVAIGYAALGGTGATNTIIGNNSFSGYNTSGSDNSTLGEATLQRINSGSRNVAVGAAAGAYVFLAASDNTYVGNLAGQLNNNLGSISGTLARSTNTFIGSSSGQANTGNSGVALGYRSGQYETADNKLFIDNQDRTNEATARTNSLIYGGFGAVANQFLTVNGTINPQSAQTTTNSSTSGSVTFSEPFSGSTYKKIAIYINASTGTTSYTYPVAFTNTPGIVITSAVGAAVVTTLSTTAVTITGAATTGYIFLEGY